MANQQLLDYIKQQIQLGVARDAIRNTLLQNGWGSSDVDEALGAPGVSIEPAAPSQVSLPTTPQAGGTGAMARDIMQPKSASLDSPREATSSFQVKKEEAVFQPKRADAIFGVKPVAQPVAQPALAPTVQKVEPAPITMAQPAHPSSGGKLFKIVASILIVGFAVTAGWFFKVNMDLEREVTAAEAQRDTLSQQVSNLTSDAVDLKAKNTALETGQAALMKELKIFMLPDSSLGTSTPESIVLRGTLSGDDKTPYTLTTDNRVRVNIKNYKDPKVQAVLKPLLGTVVEVGGSYIPSIPDVTVTELAGKPIQ